MKLLLLGTTGYHPSDARHTACFMLPEIGVVLDAGTAFFRVRDHLQTDTLDIFLSHAHLDHVFGLTFLIDVLYEKQMQHVRVHGDPAKLAAIEQHVFAEDLFPVDPPYEPRPLSDRVELADGGVLTHCRLEHPGGSIGYRIDWPDRSLAYITDTTAGQGVEYIDFIRGVDLLIHESYFPDGWDEKARITGHSCISAAAQVAADANVGRLLLVHMSPLSKDDGDFDLPAARTIFSQTEIGHDGMEVNF